MYFNYLYFNYFTTLIMTEAPGRPRGGDGQLGVYDTIIFLIMDFKMKNSYPIQS